MAFGCAQRELSSQSDTGMSFIRQFFIYGLSGAASRLAAVVLVAAPAGHQALAYSFTSLNDPVATFGTFAEGVNVFRHGHRLLFGWFRIARIYRGR